MSMINASNPTVLIVTTMPRIVGVILTKRKSERKAIKKKKVQAKIPAPKAGNSRSGTRRLKP